MIESAELTRAVERCEQALADWAATIAKAKVTKIQDLSATTGAGNLFIQLLANYEFALERADRLGEALAIAQLSRTLDPSDPENLLSSIISLYIRIGDPMATLRCSEPSRNRLRRMLGARALAWPTVLAAENAVCHSDRNRCRQMWRKLSRVEWCERRMLKLGEAVSELQAFPGY